MKYKLLSLILASMCMIFGCKSTKNISPDSFEGKQIRFGSGGGITGAVTQWALLENGRLWGVSGAPNAVLKEVGKVSKKVCTEIFEEALTLEKMKKVNDPGNMYCFVEIHHADGVTKMVWNPSQKDNYSVLNTFFDRLKVIMKEKGPAPAATEMKEVTEEN